MRDLGLPVSAVERPRTHVFGAELYPALHMRFFLRANGLPAGHPVPPVQEAGPFVEAVAQDHCDVPVIAKRLTEWFPVRYAPRATAPAGPPFIARLAGPRETRSPLPPPG